MSIITVSGEAPYDVRVGAGILRSVADMVPAGVTRALVISVGTLPYAAIVARALQDKGIEVHQASVPDAEAAKTIEVATRLWSQLGQAGFTRSDIVVGVGGGTVTDLAGFVAASWLRGVGHIEVPTTVLGMVDAAVGGKTGINTAEGKNLVGAFHPPIGVVCDIDVLASLPRADYVAGMAEVIKAGFIADPMILDLVESDPVAAGTVTGPHTAELIERAIQVKADVVGVDLKESGLREILNYGHTLGHAIEQAHGYQLRHGEAVALGMVFIAELACDLGLIDDELVRRHRRVLDRLGLPISYDAHPLTDLLAAMGRDKKTRGSTLRLVALRGLADPTRIEGPTQEQLQRAFDRLTPAGGSLT